MSEIESLLAQYQAFGRNGSIDLRWLSLLPGDLDRLHDVLGTGEVSAQVNALGISTARETAIQCVWWVEHGGPEGESLGQWIEVSEVASRCAAIARRSPTDLRRCAIASCRSPANQ